MQTHGRPGCHYMHLENAYLLRVAAPRELKTKFDPHSRKQHRMDEEVRDGHCSCCSGLTSSPHHLPPGLVATSVMEKGFMVKQPLCFGCANGVARVMLDTCAEPGGIKSGSRLDRIQADSNIMVERQEKRTRFDEAAELRRKRAEAHFEKVLAATRAVPDLGTLLAPLDDGAGDETPDAPTTTTDEAPDATEEEERGGGDSDGEEISEALRSGGGVPVDVDLSGLLSSGLDDT